jgi:hypothetical protein
MKGYLGKLLNIMVGYGSMGKMETFTTGTI